MRKAIAILTLVLAVSVHTPAGELYKLPFLVSHFMKHQQQDKLSFGDFIWDHYAVNHEDGDLPEDEQLPFKQLSYNGCGYAIISPAMVAELPALLQQDPFGTLAAPFTGALHARGIFHPPQA